jgi:citrate synthase
LAISDKLRAEPRAEDCSLASDNLKITDQRTDRSYDLAITEGTIKATDLRKIKISDEDFGLMTYDPAFMNTAAARSAITFIDGDKGILEYRGYPIEQLAGKSTYMEVAYLLLHGDLPTRDQLDQWSFDVTHHTILNENLKSLLDAFRYNAHPMGQFISMMAALGTFYPEAKDIFDPGTRKKQIVRIIAKVITIAAFSYRHRVGMPYAYPDNDLTYPGNFLNMMFRITEPRYKVNPSLEHALDVLFILHADHEQNASTSVMRSVGSSHVDPYSAVAAAAAALYGPLHGGANEAVIHMLTEIGSVKNVPGFIQKVKAGEGTRLMGFGHRVYKNYDPRAKIIKHVAYEVFEVTGKSPLLDIALELERIALQDDYFAKRKLYPNVDFYSGLIYQALGIPMEMFTVMFAIPRVSGWLTQWGEMLDDPDQKIARPRQIFTGSRRRDYKPVSSRT